MRKRKPQAKPRAKPRARVISQMGYAKMLRMNDGKLSAMAGTAEDAAVAESLMWRMAGRDAAKAAHLMRLPEENAKMNAELARIALKYGVSIGNLQAAVMLRAMRRGK